MSDRNTGANSVENIHPVNLHQLQATTSSNVLLNSSPANISSHKRSASSTITLPPPPSAARFEQTLSADENASRKTAMSPRQAVNLNGAHNDSHQLINIPLPSTSSIQMSQLGITERTPKTITITIDEQTSPPPSYDSASPRLEETDNESDNDDASTPVLGDDEDSASGGKNGALMGSKQKWNTVPDDKKRALMAFGLLFLAGLSNDLVLAFIHERVPDYKPLPDLIFSYTPYVPFALTLSEMAMLFNTVMAITITLLNKHRWTLLKRLLLVSAMLYAGRAISMLVTQVPVADPKYYCSPKLNETSFTLVFERAISLVSGLGLSIGGKHVLCGDYIYSGHTVVLVHSYYIVRYYTPRRWWPLHTLSWLLALFGVSCLLLSRGHYTVDIVIAYWITSRLFIAYHTMCSIPALRHRTHANLMSKMCWFRLFLYMEKDVPCKVPLRFEWPLPWPRALVRSTSKTNMY
jgi:shingomyelin synthase